MQCGSVAEWLGCWTCNQQVAGSNPGLPTVEYNHGQVVNTHVPPCAVQYNLAPAYGRWCRAAGKVTVGLASHWPRVVDSRLKALEREMSTCLLCLVECGKLYLYSNTHIGINVLPNTPNQSSVFTANRSICCYLPNQLKWGQHGVIKLPDVFMQKCSG